MSYDELYGVAKVLFWMVVWCGVIWPFMDWLYFRYFSRKCRYDCSKCRYWPCPTRECEYRRKKLNENKVKAGE